MKRKLPQDEIKVYGVHACQMIFQRRPQDIVRVHLKEKLLKQFSALIHYCVANRLAYHVVDDDDLEKFAQSLHHEGVAMLVRGQKILSPKEFLERNPQANFLLGLEKIDNPHNLGALLRTAAHFGVDALLVADAKKKLTGAALRVAQGGAEWIELVDVANWKSTLGLLNDAQFSLYGTSSHRGQSVFHFPLKKKALLLLGPEREGLSAELSSQLDQMLCIPGTGHVESLNIAQAAAVILGQYWVKHKVN